MKFIIWHTVLDANYIFGGFQKQEHMVYDISMDSILSSNILTNKAIRTLEFGLKLAYHIINVPSEKHKKFLL